VSGWTRSWLPGAPDRGAGAQPGTVGQYPGERLGLPAQGPGAVAGLGRRLSAFVLDLLLSTALAALFTLPRPPGNWSLPVWAVLTVLLTAVAGVTPGMALLGLRVVRLETGRPVGVLRALLRTVLLFFVLPAVVLNTDRRGLHDLAANTVVLRAR
jgi:uncharacterized RDD family membrane protein YckC